MARSIAAQVTDAEHRAYLVGCAPQDEAQPDDRCSAEFLGRVGRLLYRRPLAADELAPTDEAALRATGFLARNFNSLSRERWLENTIGHTFQAFQGVTMNCAKCHDHMYDPISQREYYEVRSIFEAHQVRTDRVPGQVDTDKTGDGLVRIYDATIGPKTYVLTRGDERKPLTNEVMQPNVPRIFGAKYEAKPVTLPLPERR